ncbi:YcaO-like family protein [Streptomyces osmaniensis]|uniref:YcaO domain-containing protein n=1 Tax=Streptomyces osmaniensis TaxID=593134 RepID=A0ABP6XUY3_9ACTN|nr:YcaO-like family protein [Streptomyces sp. JCM17656]
MHRLRLPGTHRAVAPEITWERIAPHLLRYGITRVADVTRLDNIGIPVFLAVRPGSETLAVSQGKGASPLLAKLSAVMESIELWHAEQPQLDTFTTTPASLRLPYTLADLNLRMTDEWIGRLTLPWVEARSLLDGRAVPVPLDLVRLSYSGSHFWRPRLFESSSTGLASGNTFTEACLHALYEAIERDVLAAHPSGTDPRRLTIDPDTIRDAHLRSLLGLLSEAGVDVRISCIPNRFAVPTFAAFVWSPLFPIVCAGSGSHLDPVVAVSRALTEAVQSRLTEISATRDDIPSDQDTWRDASPRPRFPTGPDAVPLDEALSGHEAVHHGMERELEDVTRRITDVTGHAPLVVRLSGPSEPFSVVRVVCPGLSFAEGRTLSA